MEVEVEVKVKVEVEVIKEGMCRGREIPEYIIVGYYWESNLGPE